MNQTLKVSPPLSPPPPGYTSLTQIQIVNTLLSEINSAQVPRVGVGQEPWGTHALMPASRLPGPTDLMLAQGLAVGPALGADT